MCRASTREGDRHHNSLVIDVLAGPQISVKRTKAKRKRTVARATGIPTTRTGKKKKAEFTSNVVLLLFAIAMIMYFYFLF